MILASNLSGGLTCITCPDTLQLHIRVSLIQYNTPLKLQLMRAVQAGSSRLHMSCRALTGICWQQSVSVCIDTALVDHRWQARIFSVYNGNGCPCCSGHQACLCNSLHSLHPDIAAEWDYTRNEGSPSDYSARSSRQVWWQNSNRGLFCARINARTRYCWSART